MYKGNGSIICAPLLLISKALHVCAVGLWSLAWLRLRFTACFGAVAYIPTQSSNGGNGRGSLSGSTAAASGAQCF